MVFAMTQVMNYLQLTKVIKVEDDEHRWFLDDEDNECTTW